MTYREKNIPAPAILSSPTFEGDTIASISARSDLYSSSRYGHNDVREALNQIYGKKCAYCECKITPVATANVDHFRPINTYATAINPQNHLGYYWLGYEWTNLIQSCPSCNQTKSSKFHLSVPTNRQPDAPPLVGVVPNYSEHRIDSTHLANEDSLLINPERIDPDNHLYVNYFGLLEVKNGSIYGTNTIEICDLNRDGLYTERSELINSFVSLIEDEIIEHYREDGHATTDHQFQERLNKIFKSIIAQQNIELEYNMTARCIVERFDELILEDIEKVFRREIRGYFVQFLNTV